MSFLCTRGKRWENVKRSLRNNMKTIRQTYLINATPDQVFKALTNPKIIEQWSGAPATMSARKGSTFSLWDGWNYGKNLEVVRNEKLVQEWRSQEWEEPSKVTFTLKGKGRKTEVELTHENVPDNGYKKYSDGWKEYYLGAIRKLFE